MAITPNYTIWNNIIIIIALDFFYNNFKIIINNIFKNKNKSSNKAQQILVSMKAKSFSKRTIGVIKELAIIFKKKNLRYNNKKNN